MNNPIPDAALDDRLGFVGTAGSGKTYGAGTCIERLLDRGARVIVVDPLGVWYGLRLIADGSAPSRYSMPIFGGAHGDLPLNEHAGKLIGETVASMAESCIVALDLLQTKSAERRFMLTFLDALYRKANGEPVHVIFDEADLWAPQKSTEPMLQSLMEQICRRGRVKGLIPWLITQRPAVVSKDVLSQIDGLVAFKLTSSQDRDALEGWIEGQADRAQWKEIRAKLPTVERGQGVVWLPARGIIDMAKFPPKRTFDSSRTPARGEKKRVAQLKPLNIDALKAKLFAVADEAKANDPKELRAEVARLKSELQRAQKNAAQNTTDPKAIEEAAAEGFERAKKQLYREAERYAYDMIASAMQAMHDLVSPIAVAIEERIKAAKAQRVKLDVEFVSPATQRPARVSIPLIRQVPAPQNSTNGKLEKPLQKIINAIRWWNVLGVPTPSYAQVAFAAGYSHKSGTWATYLSRLRSMGLIEGRGDMVLTQDGAAVAQEPGEPPNAERLRAMVADKLDAPLTRILLPILNAYPDGLSHQEAAERAGYSHSSGTWATYLSRLRSLDLIKGRGELKAQEWLFPV